MVVYWHIGYHNQDTLHVLMKSKRGSAGSMVRSSESPSSRCIAGVRRRYTCRYLDNTWCGNIPRPVHARRNANRDATTELRSLIVAFCFLLSAQVFLRLLNWSSGYHKRHRSLVVILEPVIASFQPPDCLRWLYIRYGTFTGRIRGSGPCRIWDHSSHRSCEENSGHQNPDRTGKRQPSYRV